MFMFTMFAFTVKLAQSGTRRTNLQFKRLESYVVQERCDVFISFLSYSRHRTRRKKLLPSKNLRLPRGPHQ